MKHGQGKSRRHGGAKRRHRPPAGARPGTLMLPDGSPKPALRVMRYLPEGVDEVVLDGVDQVPAVLEQPGITWLDVHGLGDEATLLKLGRIFSIHPLALEDVVHLTQRPKTEPHSEHVFVVTRMVRSNEHEVLDSEQVSLFFGERFVLTFQERPGDVLDPVRTRLRDGKGPMRSQGPDYLAYAILDAIIDGYFPVMERVGEELEQLEDRVLEEASPDVINSLNDAKRKLLQLRRNIWPQRESLSALMREESVSENVRVYLRDTYDHCVQLADIIETYRELNSGLLNTYLSIVANRTNEVMKVLTIMATVFIPLTFLAGIYGMNFQHMPELAWRWSYGVFWIVTIALAAGLFYAFKRKGWIGKD